MNPTTEKITTEGTTVIDISTRAKSNLRGIRLAVRGLIAGVGICSIVWAFSASAARRAEAPFGIAARDILRGESFDAEKLGELKRQLDSTPEDQLRPAAMDNVAIIRLRLLDAGLADRTTPAGSTDQAEVGAILTAALSQDPSNSFLWLADYWLDRSRGDVADLGAKFLRMSYQSGPNEGWIAMRRNPVALGNFSSLPGDLSERALSEFVRLVQSGLYGNAVNILVGPGWPVRQQLLSRLAPLDEDVRFAMAREIARKDFDGVSLSGIQNEPPSRPF
jgi:hypothetical protein